MRAQHCYGFGAATVVPCARSGLAMTHLSAAAAGELQTAARVRGVHHGPEFVSGLQRFCATKLASRCNSQHKKL